MQPNNKRAEEEALTTGNLLDQIGRAEGDPWLFERIQTRLNSRGNPSPTPARALPAWEWALVALAVFSSTLFFSANLQKNDAAQNLGRALAEELEINDHTAYQIEI